MGAWIETVVLNFMSEFGKVAPYVGAWIETFDSSGVGQIYLVAPYVGAWIETANGICFTTTFLSHPTWVRGLKQAVA